MLLQTLLQLLQAFLSLCQGNHYQFDTIRRAKHSSAMVLYHLHNPDAPAFAATCNGCSREIDAGSGFRCTVCNDFDLCVNCKQIGVGMRHPHPLAVRTCSLMTRLVFISDLCNCNSHAPVLIPGVHHI